MYKVQKILTEEQELEDCVSYNVMCRLKPQEIVVSTFSKTHCANCYFPFPPVPEKLAKVFVLYYTKGKDLFSSELLP